MADPKVRDMLIAKVDELTGRMTELVDEVRAVTEQLHPERARSCEGRGGAAGDGRGVGVPVTPRRQGRTVVVRPVGASRTPAASRSHSTAFRRMGRGR
jgi:hypothetical protein